MSLRWLCWDPLASHVSCVAAIIYVSYEGDGSCLPISCGACTAVCRYCCNVRV